MQRRVARSLVSLLVVGLIEAIAPGANAATLAAPTITSITAGNGTLAVNLDNSNNPSTFWAYSVTRRDLSSNCVNPYQENTLNYTPSLVASIPLTGLTNGCNYSIRVASYYSGIGNWAEGEGTPTNYAAVLNYVYQNDSGSDTTYVRTPFSTGCASGTVSQISNISFDGSTTRPGTCNYTQNTGYYYGYIKAPYTGTVTFRVTADDAAALAIQGNTVAFETGNTNQTGTMNMVQGQVYRFEAWFHNDGGGASADVKWSYTGQTEQVVPAGSFANDPSVLASDGGCSLGMAARCAGGSALEIKQATGTNLDGQYWINIGGTPTLVYCIMNSVEGGGGWMLAMRGKNSASTFNYESVYWTNDSLTGTSSYPERFSATDTYRNADAKYAPFTSIKGGQIMALYPEVNGSTQTGGAWANNSNGYGGQVNVNGVSNTDKYGFAWAETYSANMSVWTTFNGTTGFGGDSYNFNLVGAPSGSTAGPGATAACPNSVNTLQYLFSNATRCAFRTVKSNFDVNETPYSAVGNNIFYSQTDIRFFGINYGNSSTGDLSKVRFGFGWNENGDGIENSNDGNAGVGIYDSGATTLAAGTYNQCCSNTNHSGNHSYLAAGQTGMSGGNGTATHLGFELYVRNMATPAMTGSSSIRVTSTRAGSGSISQSYSQTASAGTPTYHISPVRTGFNIDSSTGTLKVNAGLAPGTYYETVTAIDGNAASSGIAVTITVVGEASDTDTAMSFNGSSNYTNTTQTWTLSGDLTVEAWVKPSNYCTENNNQYVVQFNNVIIICKSNYWLVSLKDSGGTWNEVKLNSRVLKDEWTHLAVVRSSTTVRAYINNVNVYGYVGSAWTQNWTQSTMNTAAGGLYVGGIGSANTYFAGLIDEVKAFNSARSLTDIWTNAHQLENVANINLLAYYDFNEDANSTAYNRAQTASSGSDLSVSWNGWTSVASIYTSGPYTYIKFLRSVINSIGGWKAPDSITAITTTIIAGGGGGGGGYEGGGGGAGGVIQGTISIVPKVIYPIKIGTGGRGTTNPMAPTSGDTTTAFGRTAVGGGSGAYEMIVSGNTQGPAAVGGSGGGGSWGDVKTGAAGVSGQGFAGGDATTIFDLTNCSNYQFAGAGGGGMQSAGASPSCSKGGDGGGNFTSIVTMDAIGGGGGGSSRNAVDVTWQGIGRLSAGSSGYISGAAVDTASVGTGGAQPGVPNSGGGGGAGMSTDGLTGYGGDGGSGAVFLRYITKLKPTFTYPTNAYLDLGQTETFTTNALSDSLTAGLTRTFRWESSTTGVNGTFSLIKQGTRFANASFSWIPTDTSTTGSNFVYRVIVTDSDTAGLFIVDTSTAVYATINGTMTLVSKSMVTKTVGISKMETFTVASGTPTYTYTLSPTNPFFWIDTATATTPRIRIADTATVGTYLETFTVTDSVSASIDVPMTIVISPPPSFSAGSAQVDSGTVLYLDAANSASYPGTGTSWSDLSGRNLSTSMTYSSGTSMVTANGVTKSSTTKMNSLTCAAPAYSTKALGTFTFDGTTSCAYTSGVGLQLKYSYETWIQRDGPQTTFTPIVMNPQRFNSDQANIVLYWSSPDSLLAGLNNGSSNSATSQITIPDKTWVFVSVTYSGSTLTMEVRDLAGNVTTATPTNPTITWDSSTVDNGLIFGQGAYSSTTLLKFKGSISSFRLFNRVLSTNEFSQDFNATKDRFLGTLNENAIKQKYASRFVDTYTVTAGSESITATFTTSAISGIKWDTTTARSLVLTLQDTLTPGTYYDTITATDIYGSVSRLPLTFTIAKADTITVYVDTPTVLSYTGNKATFTQSIIVTGITGLESGTSTVGTVKFKPGGTTCATGGYCRVGDIGPSGGIVFIDTSTTSSDGRIYEAAPYNWTGSDDLASVAAFCSTGTGKTSSVADSGQYGIGWGDTITAEFDAACSAGAVQNVADLVFAGYSDWFVPDTNELIELAKVRNQAGLIRVTSANWSTGTYGYWGTSHDGGNPGGAVSSLVTVNGAWNIGSTLKDDAIHNMVRPVRAFKSCWAIDTCTALATTDTPTAAGIYSIVPSALTVTSGSLNNYAAVNYISTPLIINKIAPKALNIPWISTSYPDTFTVNVSITAGNGTLTYSTTNGTASGCALDYKKIYTTSQGTCSITITRAADRNFTADTTTATILFLAFVNSQPTGQVGSGSTIAINGVTSYTIDTTTPPSISLLSATTISLAARGTFTITGTGFDLGGLQVKFYRNKLVTPSSSSATTITFNVIDIESAGAASGRITVITVNGQAVSTDSLTITP